jgi:hypothetical protein
MADKTAISGDSGFNTPTAGGDHDGFWSEAMAHLIKLSEAVLRRCSF